MELDQVSFSNRQDRIDYLFRHFQPYIGRRVLDIGCDQCHLKKHLPEGSEYTGIDIGGTPDIQMDLESIDRLPFDDEAFDTVIAADVLEHLNNLHFVFAEILRVARQSIIISWPNNWCNARVPIQRGRGAFKFYGLPAVPEPDRHKWFFNITDAQTFVLENIRMANDVQSQRGLKPTLRLTAERIVEKPKAALLRSLRHLWYPNQEHYCNRYAHTYWTVLSKTVTSNQ